MEYWIYGIIYAAVLIPLFYLIWKLIKIIKADNKLDDLNGPEGLGTDDFLKMRNSTLRHSHRSLYGRQNDFAGVYAIINETNGRFYVGKSSHVLDAVNKQINGYGNRYIYSDRQKGHSFNIRTFPLSHSECLTLETLKRKKIAEYKTFLKSY